MINIPFPKHSAIGISEAGQKNAGKEHDKAESNKLHCLRVGSSGCITPQGEFFGQNPYVVLARFMGYSTPIDMGTRNIFDTGFANEAIWEANISASGLEWGSGEDHPVVTRIGDYPLTGRGDIILTGLKEGIELKAICSSNTIRIFNTQSPKPDNLIQSAAYSYYLGMPWTLVYTAGFNHYGLKAGKIEFPIKIENGTVFFRRPDGEIVETIITIQGIEDYYKAIIEAFETKDHSWFNWSPINYDGMDFNYWDDYNNFLLAVDSSLPWDDWETAAKIASDSTWVIQLVRKKGTSDKFKLENTLDKSQSKIYTSLGRARDGLRETVS